MYGAALYRLRPADFGVMDTSFFLGIGAVNPALTAMANAIRSASTRLRRAPAFGEHPPSASTRLRRTPHRRLINGGTWRLLITP